MDPQQPAPNPSQPQNVVFLEERSQLMPAGPKQLPLSSFHIVFGVIQMIGGVLMIALEVVAIFSHVPFTTGPGIYCGVLIVLCGLLSVLSGGLDSRPSVIACMVLNIVATLACVVGLGCASVEVAVSSIYMYPAPSSSAMIFWHRKSVIIVIYCVLEFVLTIVHASLSCRSVCSCCMPHPANKVSGHPGLAYQTAFPAHGAGHVPQGWAVTPQGGGYMGQQPFTNVGHQQPQVYPQFDTAGQAAPFVQQSMN